MTMTISKNRLLLAAADLIDKFAQSAIAQREGIELHLKAPGFEGENFTAILRRAAERESADHWEVVDGALIYVWTCECGDSNYDDLGNVAPDPSDDETTPCPNCGRHAAMEQPSPEILTQLTTEEKCQQLTN